MIKLDDQTQKDAFLGGEGDAWWYRNREILRYDEDDPVIAAVTRLPTPRTILEIGCSNGGRLEALRQRTGATCTGVDPSIEAIAAGRTAFPELHLAHGTADTLPFDGSRYSERFGGFDIVIFGFCLYLCDRRKLFCIVAEADRVLADGGHLVIHDFWSEAPKTVPYRHCAGLFSYKMNYARLFLSNPAYTMCENSVSGKGDDALATTVLAKDVAAAFDLADESGETKAA